MLSYHSLVSHSGNFSVFTDMLVRCGLCRHKIDPTTHKHCRSHAQCARGNQYWSVYCPICIDLWERARDLLRDPEDALVAWSLLRKWIEGFIKNSRNRPKDVPAFASKRERDEYYDMSDFMKVVSDIPLLDLSSEASFSDVSCILFNT